MDLKKVDDLRVIELKEIKGFEAGLTLTGAAFMAIGVVIFFAMMYLGVFTSSTIKSVIPTAGMSTNMTNLMSDMEEQQVKTFNVMMIIPIFFAIVGLIQIIMGLLK